MHSVAISTPAPLDHEAPAVTLKQLLDVLGELTENEDEIVATMLHMVECGRVRLVTPLQAEAL